MPNLLRFPELGTVFALSLSLSLSLAHLNLFSYTTKKICPKSGMMFPCPTRLVYGRAALQYGRPEITPSGRASSSAAQKPPPFQHFAPPVRRGRKPSAGTANTVLRRGGINGADAIFLLL